MKTLIFASLLLASFVVQAQTQPAPELVCWNMFSPRGSRPIMKAFVGPNNALKVSFNFEDKYFENYIYNSKGCYNDDCIQRIGTLQQVQDILQPRVIDSNRTSYKGNNEYRMILGSTSVEHITQSTGVSTYRRDGQIPARLILPPNLSSSFLQTYRIRNSTERSNAVVVIAPPEDGNQTGDNFLRLFCISNIK